MVVLGGPHGGGLLCRPLPGVSPHHPPPHPHTLTHTGEKINISWSLNTVGQAEDMTEDVRVTEDDADYVEPDDASDVIKNIGSNAVTYKQVVLAVKS